MPGKFSAIHDSPEGQDLLLARLGLRNAYVIDPEKLSAKGRPVAKAPPVNPSPASQDPVTELLKILLAQRGEGPTAASETQPGAQTSDIGKVLNLPFACGEQPAKPTVKVRFGTDMGYVSCGFHAAIRTQDGATLVLVRDSRWDGDEYMPPRTDDPARPKFVDVSYPSQQGTTEVRVVFLGCGFSLGVFDILTLAVTPRKENRAQETEIGHGDE